MYNSSFITTKGYKGLPAKKERCIIRVLGVPKHKASVSPEYVILLANHCIAPTREAHPSPSVQNIYYVGTIDWIIGHMFELSLQPPPLPGGKADICGLKPQSPNHTVGPSGVTSPKLKTI